MTGWRDFCSEWWLDKADRLEAEWADGVPVNWYASRTVWDMGLFSMDYGHMAAQLAAMPPEYVDGWGSPTPTDVNHLYHLWTSGVRDGWIVEWGGGFGNMASIARSLNGDRYTVVDIPIMRQLQRAYLRRATAGDLVRLSAHDHPALTTERTERPSLFIAAFSLDECTAAAHDFLFGCDWYDAETVLIVAQTEGKEEMFPDAASLAARLRAAGFVETPALQDKASYFRLERNR